MNVTQDWISGTGAGGRKPTRVPVLLSALVLPGTGQCLQRRWLAAAFYGIGFLLCLGAMLAFSRDTLSVYYNAWDMEGPSDEVIVRLRMLFWRLLFSFGAAMVLYIGNIVDANWAYRRALARWLGEERLRQMNQAAGINEPMPDQSSAGFEK